MSLAASEDAAQIQTASILDQKLAKSSPGLIGTLVFAVMLIAGVIYIWTKLSKDLSVVHSAISSATPSSTKGNTLAL